MRIAGIDLDSSKHLVIALTGIYGIGRSQSQKICKSIKIDGSRILKSITEKEADQLRDAIKQLTIEGDLIRKTALNIKRLIDIKCYKGRRHRFSLPVHGQRTRSNACTARKRNKATVASKS